MHTSNEKILIVGPSWVGDMVMAHALLRCLSDQHPGAQIDVLAPNWALPLVARMPEVRQGLNSPFDHGELRLWQRRNFGRSLRIEGYTQAIVLPNSFKSALVPYFANIPLRTGWVGEQRRILLNDSRVLDKVQYSKMVERFAALAYAADAPLPACIPDPQLTVEPTSRDAVLGELELTAPDNLLAICPGAEFGPAKQWPTGHYAALCNAKLAEGWDVWIFGSENDKRTSSAILAEIAPEYLDHVQALTGRTTLAQAIDLLSLSTVVVTNDSGLMHIAAALNKPIVALYGSTSPDFTPPLAKRVKLLATNIECRPCFERECPLGHLRCLTELSPEQGIRAIEELVAAE